MKALQDRDLAIVFVGCGGTFWATTPYFSALIKLLKPEMVVTIDPDMLTEENTARQWCNKGGIIGSCKADLAIAAVMPTTWDEGPTSVAFGHLFDEWSMDPTQQELIKGRNVLMVVNVDNDEARFQIREWAIEHPGRVVMVMSGCDMNYGQVYYGVYDMNRPIHDWMPLHPDVGGTVAPENRANQGCGAQSTDSNFLTGALFAPAIHEALGWIYPNRTVDGAAPRSVGEWYWRIDPKDGKLKAWTTKAAVYVGNYRLKTGRTQG